VRHDDTWYRAKEGPSSSRSASAIELLRFVRPAKRGLIVQSNSLRLFVQVTLISIALALPSSAAAAEAPQPLDKEVSLSSYLGLGRGAWIFASAGAALWLVDRLSIGAYFDAALAGDPLEADCGPNYCAQQEYKVGARARWHISPAFIVDPWVGIGIGGRFDVSPTKNINGIDASASIGADVRLGRVAFGPFGFIEQPLVHSPVWSLWQGQLGVGIRGDYRF